MPAAVNTLRVLVDAAPDPERSAEWVLFDAANRVLRAGRDRPSSWPESQRREAVIAASQGRLVTLALPPLPPARVAAAARYALEDQLADAPEDSHVAVSAQSGDGGVRAAIVAEHWMRAFAAGSRRCGITWDRGLLESDLAITPPATWRWCAASVAQPGFIRTDRGTTIAIGAASADAPPHELSLALAGAGERRPRSLRVDAAGASATLLANASRETRVEFVAGTPWRWSEASPAAFAGAIDLLSGGYGRAPAAQPAQWAKLLRPALWIVAIAIGIGVCSAIGEWLWLRWQAATLERDLEAVARTTVPEYASGATADLSPATALLRRQRSLQHAAGLAADDDFLPLLARSAAALGTLPPGALRAMGYADGHLTLELQKLDAAQTSALQRQLQQSRLVAIAVPSSGGMRLRIGLN